MSLRLRIYIAFAVVAASIYGQLFLEARKGCGG